MVITELNSDLSRFGSSSCSGNCSGSFIGVHMVVVFTIAVVGSGILNGSGSFSGIHNGSGSFGGIHNSSGVAFKLGWLSPS